MLLLDGLLLEVVCARVLRLLFGIRKAEEGRGATTVVTGRSSSTSSMFSDD